MLRSIALGFAAAAAIGGATAASAVTYNVSGAGVYNDGRVQMTGTIAGHGAFDRNEVAGIVVLNGTTDKGKPFTVVTYCFDLLHNVNVGFGYQAGVNYTYTSVPVTNDLTAGAGMGNALTAGQIERMSGLARLGATLYMSGASDLTARMTAIQSAIWTVEYGLSASGFNPGNALGYYNDYLSRSFPGASVPVLVASDAQGQLIGNLQGLGNGAVPEPGTWALMIVGYGLVGVGARRRAMRPVAA
jgi:hypothetical protein